MFDRGDGDFHDERIAAGAAVAFENLVRLLRYLDDVAVIDAADAHSDECRDGQSYLGGVDLGPIARDYLGKLKFLNPHYHGGCRQTYAAAELGKADTSIQL